MTIHDLAILFAADNGGDVATEEEYLSDLAKFLAPRPECYGAFAHAVMQAKADLAKEAKD